jgi:gamma-glutamyl-gamma-aminobutyrate hydrolase PuuD
MRLPVILITCDVQESAGQPTETLLRLRNNYAAAIHAAGGLPLILPPVPDALPAALDMCHGVLLSGSDAGVTVPPLRAAFEQALIEQALALALPVLGICHGMQALGQALGGTVVRDDPSLLDPASPHLPAPVPDRVAHPVHLAPDGLLHRLTGAGSLCVNSLHRHALSPDGSYLVSATAPDGVTEAIEAPHAPFCMGVQWHPEYLLTETDRRLLHAFVAAAARHRAISTPDGLSCLPH